MTTLGALAVKMHRLQTINAEMIAALEELVRCQPPQPIDRHAKVIIIDGGTLYAIANSRVLWDAINTAKQVLAKMKGAS